MSAGTDRLEYHFDSFTVQPGERRLLSNGTPVEVAPRAFDVLVLLLANAGHLVSKDAMLADVWRGLIVEESNLHVQISALRKLLGADAIDTVRGEGYRFRPDVSLRPRSTRVEHDRATNLPRRLTSFVGRNVVLAALVRELAETRLLTLYGLGGSGKTRLAIRLGELMAPAHPQGLWFVDLTPVTDPARVAQAVADALGIHATPGQPLDAAIRAALIGRGALMILDNCEHLLEGCADFAQRALETVFDLAIVATSRVTLGIAGERAYHVEPMSIVDRGSGASSEAIELFVARSRHIAPELIADEHGEEVVRDLCRRLDGMPLAIELAAARLNVMSLEQLHRHLVEYLGIADDTRHADAVSPVAPLQRVLRWSHDGLSPDARRLAQRCSVFAGSFDLEAAHAVGGEEWPVARVADALQELVGRSLLRVIHIPPQPPRFAMLEIVREYMQSRLGPLDRDEVARLHFHHYLRLAEAMRSQCTEGDVAYVTMLDHDRDNLVLAHRWCDSNYDAHVLGLRLATAMQWYWIERCYMLQMEPLPFDALALGYQFMREAIARPGARTRDKYRARAVRVAGQSAMYAGCVEEAMAHEAECQSIFLEIGDEYRACIGLSIRAWFHSGFGEHDEARRVGEEALALAARLGDPYCLRATARSHALVLQLAGDPAAAYEKALESLAIARTHAQPLLDPLCSCAEYALACGDIAASVDYLQEAFTDPFVHKELRSAAVALKLCTFMAEHRGDKLAMLRFGAAYLRLSKSIPDVLPHGMHAGSNRRISQLLVASAAACEASRDDGTRPTPQAVLEEAAAWVAALPRIEARAPLACTP